MELETNYYTIKIFGFIPVTEYQGVFKSAYSDPLAFRFDKKFFTKTADGKSEEIYEVCVIGGRSVKCYRYELDLSEYATDLTLELNDFFATKKSSSASFTVKNFTFSEGLSGSALEFAKTMNSNQTNNLPIYTTQSLYNKFIRIGATVIIVKNLAYVSESYKYDTESLNTEESPIFVGNVEEVGGSQDLIEVKAFNLINSFERIKCPYLAYNSISKQVGYSAIDNAKAGNKEKLKLTLVNVIDFINATMNSKSSDKVSIVIDRFDEKELLDLEKNSNNFAVKNLMESGIALLKGKINPFEDPEFSFSVDPSFFQNKKLSEILYASMDNFFTRWFIKNNLTSLSTNSSSAYNHFIPCCYFEENIDNTYTGYTLHITSRFQYLAKKYKSYDCNPLLELEENEVIIGYNIQSSGSDIINEFNFIEEVTMKNEEGKDVKTYKESASYPPVSTVEDVAFTAFLNSQAKYGIRDKNFLFTSADVIKPETFSRDLVFLSTETTKTNFSLVTSAIDTAKISKELSHLQTNFLIHIVKNPFNCYWLAIATIKISVSNAKLQVDLGLIPSMEYMLKTEIAFSPPRNLEYTAV